MKKLKYSSKLLKQACTFSEMVELYCKKMNSEYVKNMNKLVENIARGENLNVDELKDKYIRTFNTNKIEVINVEESSPISNSSASAVVIEDDNDEVYLDKIIINNITYWYEKKENGCIYGNNSADNIVGYYKNNIFHFNDGSSF
jgi:hypothetical protein